MKKKRIYRKYKTRKKGGQHYWVSYVRTGQEYPQIFLPKRRK